MKAHFPERQPVTRRDFLFGMGATSASLAFSTVLLPRRALALNPVTHQVPSQYPTIQAAIDACISGDEILVAPGIYHEVLDYLGKSVAVRSSGGAFVTTIDATGLGDAVVSFDLAEDSGAILDGFRITGGIGNGTPSLRFGGGVYINGASPVIKRCIISGNVAHAGAGIFAIVGAPTIEDTIITQNHSHGCTTSGVGGSGFTSCYSYSTLIRCRVTDNSHEGYLSGGGASFVGGMSTMQSSLVARNTATYGGGFRASSCSFAVVCSTVTDNVATNKGGGIHLSGTSGNINMSNSILWGNSAPNSPQVFASSTASAWISTSCIEGGFSHPNATNIYTVDPVFIDRTAGNYRLHETSPLRDVGDNAAMPEGSSTDLDELPRIVNSTVDLGAYEFQAASSLCVGDINNDNQVGIQDLTSVLNDWGSSSSPADVNGDGIVGNLDLINVLNNWGPCE